MTHRGGNRIHRPPPLPPPGPRAQCNPPLGMPLSLSSPFLSLARLLAMCCLYHTGMRMWIWDCVMHMQLHLASDYARPITAVKLDCRRLSPVDRPNKTRIFSGITAVPLSLCALWFRSCILWGTTGRYLCPYYPWIVSGTVRGILIPPPPPPAFVF